MLFITSNSWALILILADLWLCFIIYYTSSSLVRCSPGTELTLQENFFIASVGNSWHIVNGTKLYINCSVGVCWCSLQLLYSTLKKGIGWGLLILNLNVSLLLLRPQGDKFPWDGWQFSNLFCLPRCSPQECSGFWRFSNNFLLLLVPKPHLLFYLGIQT